MIDIDVYFDRYEDSEGFLPGRVELIGWEYRLQGFLTQEQLYDLSRESSPHSAHHVARNTEQRCRNVTSTVWNAHDDFSKISLLCGLHGVKVPTATYILTAMDPLNHAILNKRVWTSLKYLGYVDENRDTFTAADYEEAISHIRSIAQEEQCAAAAVGYALAAHGQDVHRRESQSEPVPERIPLKPAETPNIQPVSQ